MHTRSTSTAQLAVAFNAVSYRPVLECSALCLNSHLCGRPAPFCVGAGAIQFRCDGHSMFFLFPTFRQRGRIRVQTRCRQKGG